MEADRSIEPSIADTIHSLGGNCRDLLFVRRTVPYRRRVSVSPSPSVVAKVAALLRCVAAAEPEGLTTSAAARSLRLNRSTTHRLLYELQGEGLVDRDTDSSRWVVGAEMYLLGSAASPRHDVTALAQPFVRRLAVTTGESAFFSLRRGMETVCLVREDGSFPVRSHVLYEGVRFPLGVASAGMVILAFMEQRAVDEYLTIVDLAAGYGDSHAREALARRVEQTQRLGYAVNPGLIVEGSWGMGAAVFDALGAPIGALSLTGVGHRFSRDRQPELGQELLDSAHALTGALRNRTEPNSL